MKIVMESNKPNEKPEWRRGLIAFWILFLLAFTFLVILKLYFLIDMYSK